MGEVQAQRRPKAEYINKRAFDKGHYKKMVVAYLETFVEAKREDFDNLLRSKLSDALDDGQKAEFHHESAPGVTSRWGHPTVVGEKRGKGTKWELCKPTTEGKN